MQSQLDHLEKAGYGANALARIIKPLTDGSFAEMQQYILAKFGEAKHVPKSPSQSDPKYGNKIYLLIRNVRDNIDRKGNRNKVHWAWHVPEFRKIWLEFGFEDKRVVK